MKLKVGIIGCGRMANTIEDEQIARREARSPPWWFGVALLSCRGLCGR